MSRQKAFKVDVLNSYTVGVRKVEEREKTC